MLRYIRISDTYVVLYKIDQVLKTVTFFLYLIAIYKKNMLFFWLCVKKHFLTFQISKIIRVVAIF